MESSSASQSSSKESGTPLPSPTLPPKEDTFTITKDDAKILQEYLDNFQDGDTDLQATIIANAMAELCNLRPEDEPFDKAKASQVHCHESILHVGNTNIPFRKSESGFIITMSHQRDSMSNLHAGAIHTTTCGMK
jgi:hypothetical protein